ncbi:MAG: hypothetical protein QOI26_2225 [Pseudonocardiales bacterium]|nr:hypothetical protein [Pseudonocardiales bacterium]
MPTPLLPMTRHLPVRPSWACRDCARPWPCSVGRRELAVEFSRRPALLLHYMSAQVVAFTDDLSERGLLPEAEHVFPRFIDWVRAVTRSAA